MTRSPAAIPAFTPERLGALYSALRAITEDPRASMTMRMAASTGDIATTVRWTCHGIEQTLTKVLLWKDVQAGIPVFDRWSEQLLNDVEQAHVLTALSVPQPPPDDPTTLRGRFRAAADVFRTFVGHLSVARAIRQASSKAPEAPQGDS